MNGLTPTSRVLIWTRTTTNKIFIDTSGFFCIFSERDINHVAAIELYEAARTRLTTNYVLAEYVALADARGLPREDAVSFSAEIINDRNIEVIWVDENLHRRAVELLQNRRDKNYSLCDAVSFVLMSELEISEALTTDKHFEQENFVRLLKHS